MPGSKENYNTTRHFFSTVMFVAIVAVLGAFLARISIIVEAEYHAVHRKTMGIVYRELRAWPFFPGFSGVG